MKTLKRILGWFLILLPFWALLITLFITIGLFGVVIFFLSLGIVVIIIALLTIGINLIDK